MPVDPEPIFIIKCKDNLALRTISFYRNLCAEEGLIWQAQEVRKAYLEMDKWRKCYPGHCKNPDHKHVKQNAFLDMVDNESLNKLFEEEQR